MTRARDLSNLIGSGNYTSTTFTATAGQTTFTISHTAGFIQVFMNGLLLDETADYTSNGSTVTLTTAANAGDELEVVKYNTFSVGDAITQTDADTRYVNASGDTISGNLTVNGSVTLNDSSGVSVTRGSSHSNNYEGGRVTLKNGNNYTKQYGLDTYYENFRIYRENQDGTGGVVRFEIDAEGRVKMQNQPYFAVYKSGGSITGTGVITFENVLTNRGNHYNTSNGRFTAPVAGVYLFNCQVFWAGSSSTHVARYDWRINGAIRSEGKYGLVNSTDYQQQQNTFMRYMAADDYLDINVVTNPSGYLASNDNFTWLYGFLIG